jgi:hypothetical protein
MDFWILNNKNPVDLMGLPLTYDWNVPGLMISDFIESISGFRIGEYKNYKKI